MSVIPSMLQRFGLETVEVIHAEGTSNEKRFSIQAHIQSESGFTAVDTPIYEGDILVINDRRGGTYRRLVTDVKIVNPKNPGLSNMRHIKLTFTKAPQPKNQN